MSVMQGPNQERVERDARWFVGVGCVFADDFIKKPFNIETVMKKIVELVRG